MLLILLLIIGTGLLAQSVDSDLFPNAVVIERVTIPPDVHPNRELVLWMISPEKHDRGRLSPDNPYLCPDVTLGSYYSGPTRLSLVDTERRRIVNTIRIRHDSGDVDSFDIPYRILADYLYKVPSHDPGSEGKPALLALRDINGDGRPLETVFFQALACMGLSTTLVGYSPKQDRMIQYKVTLQISSHDAIPGRGIVKQGKTTVTTHVWVDYLFGQKAVRPGQWSYKIDYSGRGGCIDTYAVHYEPSREKFFGTLSRLCYME